MIGVSNVGSISISGDKTAYWPYINSVPFVPFKIYLMVNLSYTYIGGCLNPVTGQGIECKRRFARVDHGVINCVHECVPIDPVDKMNWGEIKAHY